MALSENRAVFDEPRVYVARCDPTSVLASGQNSRSCQVFGPPAEFTKVPYAPPDAVSTEIPVHLDVSPTCASELSPCRSAL